MELTSDTPAGFVLNCESVTLNSKCCKTTTYQINKPNLQAEFKTASGYKWIIQNKTNLKSIFRISRLVFVSIHNGLKTKTKKTKNY